MIRTETRIVVACDSCGKEASFSASFFAGPHAARNHVSQRDGYHYEAVENKDYCPDCSMERWKSACLAAAEARIMAGNRS